MRHPIVEQHLRERYGMDPEVLGPAMIEAAVTRRLRALGMMSASQYAIRVVAEPAESAELVEELVVPETWFYRYPRSFELLDQVARQWLSKRRDGSGLMRVLSAPCSTGEEAWSTVICLLEAGLARRQVHVDALDISAHSVAVAKVATYGVHSFRGEEIPGAPKYLQDRGRLKAVADDIKNMVSFRQANLLSMSTPELDEKYDVVFCRNVMIYLAPASRKLLAGLLAMSVKPGGLVFSGHSENFAMLDGRFRPTGPAQSFGYKFDPEFDREPTPAVSAIPVTTPIKPWTASQRTGMFKAVPGSTLEREGRMGPASGAGGAPGTPNTFAQKPAVKSPADSGGPAASAPVTIAQARQMADSGRLSDALIACETVLQAGGPDPEAYVLLGVVHEALGDQDRAQRAYERALYLDHRHYEALVHLGLLCQRRGDATGALNYNRRAAEVIHGVKPDKRR